ncbi:MAG: hypothetical protein ACYC6L_04695 [Anaerolineae bacterium]
MFEVLLDLEINLVKAGVGSLQEIDETDCESLFDFVWRLNHTQGEGGAKSLSTQRRACDEVNWW